MKTASVARSPRRTYSSEEERREGKRQYQREYHANNPLGKLKYDLRKKYGITVEDYQRMLVEQNGVCAICSSPPPTGRTKRFHVDHNHVTGKVRGLLCHKCNVGLGVFQDSTDVLEKAAGYLRKDHV